MKSASLSATERLLHRFKTVCSEEMLDKLCITQQESLVIRASGSVSGHAAESS